MTNSNFVFFSNLRRNFISSFNLKTNYLLKAFMILGCIIFMSFQEPNYIKRISDANYRYEFYTISKNIKPKKNRVYYWFKGGAVHNSENGVTGELIDGLFTKTNHNNQLLEQGIFKKGLKKGIWKKWYVNGKIETQQKWRDGKMDGEFLQYDDKGTLITKGKYSNNLQTGKWIDYIKKDTTLYKKGIIIIKEKKLSKEEKLKLKEEKTKGKNNSKKIKSAKESNTIITKDSTKKSFIKKIFGKKEKDNKNGKSA